MFDFDDRVALLSGALCDAGIPYAFGGAIALAYHAQPRATTDIDVNIFVSETESRPVLRILAGLGVSIDEEQDAAIIRRDGQIRLTWDAIIVDLFFATFDFLTNCRDRVLWVPFGDDEIPILSAEDLAVCKIAFNREKDWLDLREMAAIQGEKLDVPYIRRWLGVILGVDDPRTRRFEALVSQTCA